MSSSEIEVPPVAPSFTPTTDDPLTAQEAFDRLQTDVDTFPTSVDLVVAADKPEPIGRSWAFDWSQHRFVKATRALGPKPTFGIETLTEWIEKCLNTARGAHPVHPVGYGFASPQGKLIGSAIGTVPPDLEQRIEEALTFHPHIAAVDEFSYDYSLDDEYLLVSFRVILDNNTALALQDVRLNLGL